MKKMMIAALAALVLVGQLDLAVAGAARKGKPGAVEKRAIERTARDASTGAVSHSKETQDIISALGTKANRVDSVGRLGKVMEANKEVRDIVIEIKNDSESTPERSRVNAATLELLSYLEGAPTTHKSWDAIKALDPVAKTEQDLVTLAINLRKQVVDGKWDATLVDNLVIVMEGASAHIKANLAPGATVTGALRAKALEAGVDALAQAKGIRINVNDISKFCK